LQYAVWGGNGWNPWILGNYVNTHRTITANQWTSVAWVRHGGTSTIYTNGGDPGSVSHLTGALNIAPGGLWLGNDQDVVSGGWQACQQWYGKLDDVRFYNRALSATEIEYLHQCPSGNCLIVDAETRRDLWGNINQYDAIYVINDGHIIVEPAEWVGGTWEKGYLMVEADTIYVDSISSIEANGVGFSKDDGHSNGGLGHGDDFDWDTHGALYNPTGAGHGGRGGSCQNTVPGANGGDQYGSPNVDPCNELGYCDPDLVFGSAGGDYFRLVPKQAYFSGPDCA